MFSAGWSYYVLVHTSLGHDRITYSFCQANPYSKANSSKKLRGKLLIQTKQITFGSYKIVYGHRLMRILFSLAKGFALGN
jgi:hypothetical protein